MEYGDLDNLNRGLARIDSKTLSDMIREDGNGGDNNNNNNNRVSWKEKLTRGNSGKGSTWTSSVPIPASDIPINSNTRMMNRHASMRTDSDAPESNRGPNMLRNSSLTMNNVSGRFDLADPSPLRRLQREEENEDEEVEEEHEKEEQTGEGERVSLMSLLGMMDDDDDDDDDEEQESGGSAGEFNSCCVCMVKHKGAAFVPCGHSFCRLCSKEMWVQKENCPLCNNYILEILDIF